MTTTSNFDPNAHMLKLKSKDGAKDYLPVQWRLVWFREQCPEGTIDTEEMCVDLDREMEEEVNTWNSETRRSEKVVKRAKGYARYRAVVTDGKGGRSTGTKSESAVSFPDFIEKAETGAIGRALAALGYGTQFTGDELDEGHRIADAPIEQKSTRPAIVPAGDVTQANALTLESVQKRAVDVGIAKTRKDWQFFNAETFGEFVPDEKLRGDEKRLAQLNDEITARLAANPAA